MWYLCVYCTVREWCWILNVLKNYGNAECVKLHLGLFCNKLCNKTDRDKTWVEASENISYSDTAVTFVALTVVSIWSFFVLSLLPHGIMNIYYYYYLLLTGTVHCRSENAIYGPVMDLWPVQRVPFLLPNDSWDSHHPPTTLTSIRGRRLFCCLPLVTCVCDL